MPTGKVSGKKQKKLLRANGACGRRPVSAERTAIPEWENRIVQGDCLEVMSRLPDASIDLIVTSPPYNFGLDGYLGHEDTKDWTGYFDWIGRVFDECARLLVPGGRIAVVVQPLFSDYVATHHYYAEALRRAGLLFMAEILWDKHNYNCKYTAWGSWRSPSLPYFKYTWEFIEVFAKESRRKPGDRDRATITGDEFKKWVYAKWDIAPERRMKEFRHPAMFPEAVADRLIKMFSYEGDLVLDPFNGAGTTTLVARRLGRRYLGIDISEEYCEIARRRIEEDIRAEAERAAQLVLPIKDAKEPRKTKRSRIRPARAASA